MKILTNSQGKPLMNQQGKVYKAPIIPVEAEENDVNFYDYDGFRVASFTIAEAKALTQAEYNAILPPTHEGLTFQEWNWSLNDITTYNRRYIDVGANYVTTDGKTHLYIKTLSNTVKLRLRFLNGTVTVDWGDGTSDTYTRTTVGITDIEHTTYLENTDYEIKLSFQQSSNDGYYSVTAISTITFITKEVNFGSYFHQDITLNFTGNNDVKISNPISNSSGLHYTCGSFYKCYVIPKGNNINITQYASFYLTPCKIIFPKEVNSITANNCCASQYNYKVVLPNITGSSAYGTGMFNNSRTYVISLPNKDLPSGDNNFLNSTTLREIDIVQGWIPNTNLKLSTSTNWIAETMVDFFNKLGTTTNTITLTFGSTNLGKLTADQKSIATNKGYTLA